MHAKRLLIGAGLLLAAGATAYWLTFFERYSKEVDRGWGAEARRNPYLAAEQYLAASGHHSRRADNLSVLDRLGVDDTLFLASSSQIYNSERARDLLEWIDRGGHAIVVARELDDGEHDWLLDELGASMVEGDGDPYFANPLRELLGEDIEDYDGKSASELLREHNRKLREGDGAEADAGDSGQEETPAAPRDPEVQPSQLVTLADANEADYRVYFNPATLLWHPVFDEDTDDNASATPDASDPVFWAVIDSQDAGVPFMQFERGEGLITLMTDAGLWQSERIGQFDHAYLLSQLSSDGDFVLLTRPRFDSLAVLARRYALEFFIAGSLALLAWLLFRTQRFGPRAAEPETARRSLLEHVSACGHYYWRTDRAAGLLSGYRGRLLRRLRGDNASQGTRRKLCVQLSENTGLNETQIASCLWGELPQSEETFTECMRNLQQIEAVL